MFVDVQLSRLVECDDSGEQQYNMHRQRCTIVQKVTNAQELSVKGSKKCRESL